jgi:hypothetical protein
MSTRTLTKSTMPRFWELHILVPGIILLCFIADLGLRLVPPKDVAFRCWEVMLLSPTADGPFTPHTSCRMVMSSGDLWSLGNHPSLRQYRLEELTTDRWGYRNPPDANHFPISILLVGDSFGAGAGVTDPDMLSAQLSRMGRVGVYNAAGNPTTGRGVEVLIKRLNLKGGLVIWQQSERDDVPLGFDREGEGESTGIRIVRRFLPPDSPTFRLLRTTRRIVNLWYAYSPLRIWVTRAFNGLRDDFWLPNLSARNVVELPLKNGQPMLFLPTDVYGQTHRTEADFFVRLRSVVESTGNELLVVLVPDKFKIYYSLLKDPPPIPADEKTFMGALARNLRAVRVPVLDLTPGLRHQAAAAYARGQYNYQIDDTHWNALGIQDAAKEILKFREKMPAGAAGVN